MREQSTWERTRDKTAEVSGTQIRRPWSWREDGHGSYRQGGGRGGLQADLNWRTLALAVACEETAV